MGKDLKTIEEQIGELIENVGKEHSVLRYVYNNGSKFVPGVSPVYYSGPYFQEDNEEIIQGIKTLLTGSWIASGEEVRKFEIAFARKINMKHALMLNSGSSANLIMIAATKKHLGWNDGDEIITSVVGFPTTVAPIVQNNLVPVFIDIEMDSLNFNLDLIEDKITDKTKAIFLSPVLGNPPNMERLVEICSKHNVILLLDDCDSLGSKWNGIYLNEYAFASSNSFFVSHHTTTMEGGMIVSNDKELIRLARSFAWWGRSCFEKNAPIFTKDGVKEIKDIIVGDEVLTHEGRYRKVTELIRNRYVGKMVDVVAGNLSKITSTENHPFWVWRNSEYIWVEAKDLVVGDYLIRPRDGYVYGYEKELYRIHDLHSYDVDDIDVYNFEVEEDHSYVAFGVAVHNCHCVGAGNLLPNGACGNRFDKHLENYDGIIDHKYVFETMGYNLKPLDFQGSIGLVQLKKFDEIHEKRISNKERIEKCILENLDVHVPTNLPEAETSWFGVPFVCKSREQKETLVAYFEEKKIQTRHYFAGNLLLHPGYKHLGNWQEYPEANKVLSHVFFIGCTPQYTEEILQYIEKVIREFK